MVPRRHHVPSPISTVSLRKTLRDRPLVYFGLAWSRAEEASACAATVVERMGLVCFDVQQNRLRP